MPRNFANHKRKASTTSFYSGNRSDRGDILSLVLETLMLRILKL